MDSREPSCYGVGMESRPLALKVYYMQNPERGADHEISVARVDDHAVDDGCRWEFGMEWHTLGRKPAVRIHAFNDAWAAFTEIRPFFDWLAGRNNVPPTLARVVEVLTTQVDGRIRIAGYWPEGCGVVGDTKPRRPGPFDAPTARRIADWREAGEPMPSSWKDPAAYIRAGLPGWDF